MDRLLESYNFPTLNEKEVECLVRPITRNEIERVIKNLSKNKSASPDEFTDKCYQTFSEYLSPLLL